MGEPVEIPDNILAEVYRHAREEFPNECCGWLTGPKDAATVVGVRRAANAYNRSSHPTAPDRSAETAYVIDGQDLLELNRSFDDSDSSTYPLVIYHSHPNGRAYFSPTDRKVATSPWSDGPVYPAQQLVVGIDADRIVVARLYDWNDQKKDFVEVAVYEGSDV